MNIKQSLLAISLLGMFIRIALAPFFIQSYDFVHFYYSVLDVAKGINPYEVYDFNYPPLMLFIFSFLLFIYFKANLFLEGINWPSFLEWPPLLIKSAVISVTLVGFHVPPPFFNLLFKLPMILADLLVALLLYKIVTITIKNAQLAYRAFLLWYFNPLVIWMSAVHGAFDSIAVLFAILSLYAVSKENFTLSGLSLGFGSFTKLYPIFIAPLIAILSIKVKKLKFFILGLLSSFAICVWPLFPFKLETLSYAILGPRASTLFLGGLNFWSVKYLLPQLEKWISLNALSIFTVLLFLLVLSFFVIFRHAWRKIEIKNLITINSFILLLLITSYLFLPIIIQAQYALWVLPFFILNILSTDGLIQFRIQFNLINYLLKINHKFLLEFYYNLFWFSALSFEIALQGSAITLPIVLKTGMLINIISLSLIYWVKNSVILRSFIFFTTGLLCTFAYLMLLIKSISQTFDLFLIRGKNKHASKNFNNYS
jgi:Gpi18-like mannosyltransferase